MDVALNHSIDSSACLFFCWLSRGFVCRKRHRERILVDLIHGWVWMILMAEIDAKTGWIIPWHQWLLMTSLSKKKGLGLQIWVDMLIYMYHTLTYTKKYMYVYIYMGLNQEHTINLWCRGSVTSTFWKKSATFRCLFWMETTVFLSARVGSPGIAPIHRKPNRRPWESFGRHWIIEFLVYQSQTRNPFRWKKAL